MKANHKRIVQTYKDIGYIVVDEFPAANVTIIQNKKTKKFKTVRGCKVQYGYNKP